MNLLASHPDVCTVGEVHQIFKGSSVMDSKWTILKKSLLRDLPMMLRTGQDFFSPRLWTPRRSLGPNSLGRIHRTLGNAKRNSGHDHLNRLKLPGVMYSQEEINEARMLGKNLDGTVFLSDVLTKIYPGSSFCGMVRHGLAVCEGHVRRGRNAKRVGMMYRTVVQKMLDDAEHHPRYKVSRFEDLLADPIQQLRTMWQQLGLDPSPTQVRLQRRKVMNEAGQHQLTNQSGNEWEVYWLGIDELPDQLDPDINRRQIQRLADRDRDDFLAEAGPIMETLGYATDGSCHSNPELVAA